MDGSSETGSVVVARNETLDLDIPLADIFNGSMSMSQDTKLDVSSAWILGTGAVVTIDNGATGGIGGAAAGTSTIAGSSFSQNAGTINVVDTDGTLQFDAPFTMNGGTLTNNGHVIFNQTATIAAAANLDMVVPQSLRSKRTGPSRSIRRISILTEPCNRKRNYNQQSRPPQSQHDRLRFGLGHKRV